MGNETLASIAEYSSTQATGTWSFDVDVTHSPSNHFYIAFFGGKWGNWTGADDFDESVPFEYGIMPVMPVFGNWNSVFVFYKRIKGNSNINPLGSFSPSQMLGWHHFDITRSIEGEFNIFINGSHCFSFQDVTYNTTEVFKFYGSAGPGIDNIVVRDDFALTSPTTTSTTTTTITTAIITTTTTTTSNTNAGLEFLAFSFLVLVLFKRKRNRNERR
jgi:hypothetical protein